MGKTPQMVRVQEWILNQLGTVRSKRMVLFCIIQLKDQKS